MFFSGADVARRDWDGPYTMRLDPSGVMLKRLNNGGAVLDCHSDWAMADQLGVVDKAWKADGQYFATLRFSKRKEVDGVWQDIADGIIQNLSMGFFIHEQQTISKEGAKQRVVLVTKWEPYEISLVPVPADANVAMLSAEQPEAESSNVIKPYVFRAAARDREIELLRLRG
jgi:hypothetical protein